MATASQPTSTKGATASVKDVTTMHLSPSGLGVLTFREGLVRHYYPDQAHNCTYGVGTLFHHGPCTTAEARTIVPDADIQASLATDVDRFELVVKQGVPTRKLTQNQFDALVSFAYNAPHNPTETLLALVEAGKDAEVGPLMRTVVYIHVRDKKGHRSRTPILSQGLLKRRNSEAAQYDGTSQ